MKLLLVSALSVACALAEEYKLGPDSERQSGVPQGKVTKHNWTSKIFPGTTRDYWIYVPAQYDAARPAAVMVFQDGGGYVTENGHSRIPIVFDNLIHRGQMPVTIGVFVNPGILAPLAETQQARYNRSYEYDTVSGRYAQFLIEEILPEVGKSYNLSTDPNLRGIAGSSSGGIAAFTAAWYRPDAFRRVLSFIGSYTNLRAGHYLPSMIRKSEGKPLRVFLQDGTNDNNIYSGSWYIGNQDMASALEYSGYEHKFVVGTEAHNMKHGGAIMPDALRWLWQDYPKPVAMPNPTAGSRRYINEIIDPARGWELVSEGHRFTEGPAVNAAGEVFFTDIPNNRIHKIALDGKVSVWKEDTGGANGLMFGPDGRLYACQNGRKRIVAYTSSGSEEVIADGVASNDIAITAKGTIYFTDPANRRVWYIARESKPRVVHEGLQIPNGVRLSPDQSLLLVAEYGTKAVWSFQVLSDGSLAHGQPFYRLETPDDVASASADGMTVDTEGHLYVTTRNGIQVCDQPGRVVGIINKPQQGPVANVVFAGPGMDVLYVMAGDKVYKRAMRRKGFLPWTVLKPPVPRM